jgi:hypothetical protein
VFPSDPVRRRHGGPQRCERTCLRVGIHPKVVSERLCHAIVSITLDTYSHAIPAVQEEAAAPIAGLVFGPAK